MDTLLINEKFPRYKYHPQWMISSASGGANALWLTEWLSMVVELRPGMSRAFGNHRFRTSKSIPALAHAPPAYSGRHPRQLTAHRSLICVSSDGRVFRRDEALRLRASGESWRSVARTLDVPMSTVIDGCRSESPAS
ncbi:MAG: hypothetical protein ABI824_08145 [Acidobacteriota bacterium]